MNAEWWVNLKELDDEQKRVMALAADKDALVVGPPGSGKTNLLLLRANYLAKAGMPNLLVIVFGRTLREFLVRGAAKYSFDCSKVVTSHRWFNQVLRDLGDSFEPQGQFEEIRQQLIERVRAQLSDRGNGPLYDAILIDEAQDFLPEEIGLFRRLGRHIFAVGDSNQKIYGGASGLDLIAQECEVHTLRHHYRNGVAICRFADQIAGAFAGYEPLTPTSNYDEGRMKSSVEAPDRSSSEIPQFIAESLARQLRAYPGDMMGVLCPRRVDAERVYAALRASEVAEHTVLQLFSAGYRPFKETDRVCVTTIHGSKGLEFRAVHAPCLDQVRVLRRQRNVVFTMATRAKTSLSLYSTGRLPGYVESALSAIAPPQAPPPLESAFGDEF